MRNCLLSISLLLLSIMQAQGQTTFPSQDGERTKYAATIEMSKGYLSGICVLLHEGNEIKGCLFNEFGISALEFTYSQAKDKVKLHSVIAMLDKWYIRKVLRKDLRALMHKLQEGKQTYTDERYNINYLFKPLTDDTKE